MNIGIDIIKVRNLIILKKDSALFPIFKLKIKMRKIICGGQK
jgi:hypothetical protein